MEALNKSSFDELDYGTKVTTASQETIEVELNPDLMVKDFAKAYANELLRLNPTRYKSEPISEDELFEYFKAILKIRVEMISNDCPNFRQAKRILIPTWIQFVISKLGIVADRSRGLLFKPKFTYSYDLPKVLEISSRLEPYQADGLAMHLDAFPREWQGDYNVMSMAIVNDYVMSITDQAHPVHSYVAGFLGHKLVEEQVFGMLYRIRYDEYSFILQQIIHDKGLVK